MATNSTVTATLACSIHICVQLGKAAGLQNTAQHSLKGSLCTLLVIIFPLDNIYVTVSAKAVLNGTFSITRNTDLKY